MEAANWYPGVLGAGLDKFNVQRSYDKELRKARIRWCPSSRRTTTRATRPCASTSAPSQHFYPGQFQALDIYTQHAWTAAMVFVEAARGRGPNLTQASLVQALNGMQGFRHGMVGAALVRAGRSRPEPLLHVHGRQRAERRGIRPSGWICS